jgi:hypothetical protein
MLETRFLVAITRSQVINKILQNILRVFIC